MNPDKFRLYQLSVQDPRHDAKLYLDMARQLRPALAAPRGAPVTMREDFCGTFALSCAWVKLSPRYRALALDLDEETLAYGRAHNLARLDPAAKRRVSVLRQDVVSVTQPAADLVVAGNFSFFYLKERQAALRYFESARRSLKPGGLHFLEVIGGKGFLEKRRESRQVSAPGGGSFTYQWEQRGFDPVTAEASYAIHFRVPGPGGRKTWLRDAFVYDWRLWTIREIREAMLEAGYRKAHVFWERSEDGEDSDEYALSERGADDEVWIAYVAGEA